MTNSIVAIDALGALGDPTRRAIFTQLATRPLAVGEIASKLPVTRSAVSQHLRVLKDVGLVRENSQGTRRIYRLDPRGIAAVRDWLDQRWQSALGAFQAYADNQSTSEIPE